MEQKICFTKTILIFYLLLTPFIMIASIQNLINVICGTGSVVGVGAFALFGFILLPVLIISSYRGNLCRIQTDRIIIGKKEYPFSEYYFDIQEYYLPAKDRPIFSPFKKKYKKIVITKKENQALIYESDLDVFKKDLETLERALPKIKLSDITH